MNPLPLHKSFPCKLIVLTEGKLNNHIFPLSSHVQNGIHTCTYGLGYYHNGINFVKDL